MPPEHERLIQIRDLIHKHFDLGEFKDLCFGLGVLYDDLPGEGQGLAARILELVLYCNRNGLMEHLVALCQQRRSHANWPTLENALQQAASRVFVAPTGRNPRQIFVSHAHQDAEFAQRLAADLRRAGWDIWIAPDSIRVGEQWVTAVNRGLEESSIFILVLTPEAAQSSWVRRETDAAIHLEQQGEIRFIPLDVKPTRRPPLWQTYQWVSFEKVYQTGLEQLLRALREEPTQILIPNTAPQAGQIMIWPKDGKEMVYVPAGEFLYGDDKQKIHLDGFWIDKTPVTNAEYKRFLDANPKHRVPFVNEDWAKPYNWYEKKRTHPVNKANHPVVLVSWHDAQAYAKWAEKQLVTEQEWEKAARGVDGREYPWGTWQDGRANTDETKIEGTSPVGQFSPQGDSPYGCVDMAGNVWEWVEDWYEEDVVRVLRGGSWYNDQTCSRCVVRRRINPGSGNTNWGFRCCFATPSLSSGSGS